MITPRDLYQQFHTKRKLMTSRIAVDKFAETDLTNYIDDLINLQSTFNASDHSIKDQTKSINEGFALLENCINLSPHVALQCKSKKFLTDLVMCLKKCQPVLDDFVTSALRFLANASTLKEWTLSFMLLDIDFSSLLWSYLLPDEIVDDEKRKLEIEKDRAKPLKFILRFFCSFSSHGRLFVRCLLKQDCLIGLNRVFATLNLADVNLITVEKIFEFLRTLSNSRDPQIVDSSLAMIGLVSRAIGCMMLAFAFSTWFVFTVPIVYMFNRFAAAALRSMISNQVEADEQGKIFAAVGFLQSACSLVATGIFNSILPVSYSFFPGLSYVLMTVIMLIPISIILYLKLAMTDFQSQHSSGLDVIDERDDLTSNQVALLNSGVDGVVEHY